MRIVEAVKHVVNEALKRLTKFLVLSGGRGTGLRPLTYEGPKQLVPIGNTALLGWVLRNIANVGAPLAGIIVNKYGPTGDEIRKYVGDGTQFGLERVKFIPQSAPKGLFHALKIGKPYLTGGRSLGDKPFGMYLGDNLYLGEDLGNHIRDFEANPDAQAMIFLTRVPDPNRFGVAVLDEAGNIVRLVEKPKEPISDLAVSGIYLFREKIFDAQIEPSWRDELEIVDAISWLLKEGYEVMYREITGWWKDTGKWHDLVHANRIVLEQMFRARTLRCEAVVKGSDLDGFHDIAQNVAITDSTIRGPVSIAPGATITDSYIGPFTSVGPDVHITDCHVENSVILEGAVLSGAKKRHRIDGSLIGKGANISRKPDLKPEALRLMVGDKSQVWLT